MEQSKFKWKSLLEFLWKLLEMIVINYGVGVLVIFFSMIITDIDYTEILTKPTSRIENLLVFNLIFGFLLSGAISLILESSGNGKYGYGSKVYKGFLIILFLAAFGGALISVKTIGVKDISWYPYVIYVCIALHLILEIWKIIASLPWEVPIEELESSEEKNVENKLSELQSLFNPH